MVNNGLLSYMYNYLIFYGRFATVVVTFGNNFADLFAHYFQNLRECLTVGLALEDRLKETKQTDLTEHKYLKVIHCIF